jgi:hypothetical protein
MNAKKLFSLFIALFGAALIILGFLHFGKNVQSEILTINIVISLMVYCLVFVDFVFPWVNLKDKAQKQIGSIGLRWFFTYIYIVLAIGAMVIFNSVKPIHFINQIIIHAVLFFILLLGLFLAFSSSDKVREVYFEEKQNRDRIDEMKRATKELQLRLDAMNNIPTEIISRINELQENLRYLSPSNNNDAIVLETKFLDEIKSLHSCFSDSPINMEAVIINIKNCERTFKERKKVFSN